MKNLFLFYLMIVAAIACTPVKKMQDNAFEIERESNKLVVRFYDKRPFFEVTKNFDYKSRYSVLKKIAIAESNVDIVDNYDVSLLAYAAANGDTEYVSSILKQGGALLFDNPDGEDTPPIYLAKHPIELAIRFGHYDVLKLLLENGYKPCCVVNCIGLDRLDMLKLMSAHGAIIDDGSIRWAAPLIYYAHSRPMVEYLVSKGCSIQKALTYAKANSSEKELAEITLLINEAMQQRY